MYIKSYRILSIRNKRVKTRSGRTSFAKLDKAAPLRSDTNNIIRIVKNFIQEGNKPTLTPTSQTGRGGHHLQCVVRQ